MNFHEEIHTLNNYLHNVLSLLKFIQEDGVLEQGETKEMLELAIQREAIVLEALNKLKKLN